MDCLWNPSAKKTTARRPVRMAITARRSSRIFQFERVAPSTGGAGWAAFALSASGVLSAAEDWASRAASGRGWSASAARGASVGSGVVGVCISSAVSPEEPAGCDVLEPPLGSPRNCHRSQLSLTCRECSSGRRLRRLFLECLQRLGFQRDFCSCLRRGEV